MAPDALRSLTARFSAGHGLRSVGGFVFPSLALVHDESVTLAMLLFALETIVASALLATRVVVSRRASAAAGEDLTRRRLHEAWRVLTIFVAPFSLAPLVMLAVVTGIEIGNGRTSPDLAAFADRAMWMSLWLLAAAVLDSVIAPVRSVHWLETSVAWQGSRTVILFVALLLGWPIMLFTGTSASLFWTFLGLRLLCDLGSLSSKERERIRQQMFGDPGPQARGLPA